MVEVAQGKIIFKKIVEVMDLPRKCLFIHLFEIRKFFFDLWRLARTIGSMQETGSINESNRNFLYSN